MLCSVTRFCLIAALTAGSSITLQAQITVNDYAKNDYVRHPRMEEEDRLRNRSFNYQPGLEIITDIDDVEIRVSGTKVGRTPWETDNLASGAYRIRLEKTGYSIQEFQVVLRSGRRTVVTVDMIRQKGKLVLNRLPPSAVVEIDRERFDGTELLVKDGIHTLLVRAFGWEDVITTIDIRPGETVTWDYPGIRAAFHLDLQDPYPPALNAGDARGFRIGWTASSPGSGELELAAENGKQIFMLPVDISKPRDKVHWIPDAGLEDGIYDVRLSGSGVNGAESGDGTKLVIDSRFIRSARFSHSGLPGLLFSPGAAMLPPSVWQISTGAGYSSDFVSSMGTEAVPAWASIRMSPLSRLEINTRFGLAARFPTENSSLFFSAAASWRANPRSNPFNANFALLYSFNGYLSELTRIPQDNQSAGLPGLQLALPMEYKVGKWFFVCSPAMNLSFISGSAGEQRLAPSPRVGGYLGLGSYYEYRKGLIGASLSMRTPLLPEYIYNWNLFAGIEARFDLPGDASFIGVTAGLRALGGKPMLKMDLEFGIIS